MKRGQVTQFIIAGLIILILLISEYVNADKKECEKFTDLAEQGAKNNIKGYKESFERQNEILRISQAAYKEKVLKNVPDFVDKTKTDIKVEVIAKEGSVSEKVEILLKDKKGDSVALIKRELYKDPDTGERVISNELIEVDEPYKRKGLSKQIYFNEYKYYRELGINRINIPSARDGGRFIWAKKEFGFEFKDFNFVDKQLNSWLISDEGKNFIKSYKGKIYLENLRKEKKSIYNLGNKPYLYPEEFLLSNRYMDTIYYTKKI